MGGVWHNIYAYGLTADATTVLGYAIVGIKNELAYNGYSRGINELPLFGNYARDRAKEFQEANGLVVDGEVGPQTARALFRKRCHALEKQYGIPTNLLNHQKTLESNNDPAAIGVVDAHDTGLMQIHLPFYTDVTVADAIDPAYCLAWAAKKLASDHSSTGDWDGALAAYNIGLTYAKKWVKDGKPGKDGPIVGGKDLYTTAADYVKFVHAMPD